MSRAHATVEVASANKTMIVRILSNHDCAYIKYNVEEVPCYSNELIQPRMGNYESMRIWIKSFNHGSNMYKLSSNSNMNRKEEACQQEPCCSTVAPPGVSNRDV